MDKDRNYFHFLILIHLLSLGAKENPAEVTSGQFSRILGKSQQTASKMLIELEKGNLIERIKNNKKFKIKVTEAGYELIKDLQNTINQALDNPKPRPIFIGRIVTGMGEGAYYMSLKGYKNQFKEKLGYEPYPGTLNIKLEERFYRERKKEIISYPNIYINGFNNNNRTFGWVKCFPTVIMPEGRNNKERENIRIESAVLLLERTHHDNSLIEVISPVCIKETANLKTGDLVSIEFKY